MSKEVPSTAELLILHLRGARSYAERVEQLSHLPITLLHLAEPLRVAEMVRNSFDFDGLARDRALLRAALKAHGPDAVFFQHEDRFTAQELADALDNVEQNVAPYRALMEARQQ